MTLEQSLMDANPHLGIPGLHTNILVFEIACHSNTFVDLAITIPTALTYMEGT